MNASQEVINILNNSVPQIDVTDIVSFQPINDFLILILKIFGGIIGIYIIYLIVSLIFNRIKNKRIKKTYQNTEEILKRLEKIDEKLDKVFSLIKENKIPEKKRKKRSKKK